VYYALKGYTQPYVPQGVDDGLGLCRPVGYVREKVYTCPV